MGGFGSGRPGWHATVEGTASLTLCLHKLARACGLRPGICAHRRWHWGDRAEITLRVSTWETWGAIELDGWAETDAHGSFDVKQKLMLLGIERGLPGRKAGRTYLFSCPRTRVLCTKLFLPNGATRFASRRAYRLTYQSQRETPADRMQRKAQKLWLQLGGEQGEYVPGGSQPERPKGMRAATHEKLTDRWLHAEEQHDIVWCSHALRVLR